MNISKNAAYLFTEHLKAMGRSEQTIRAYRSDLNMFFTDTFAYSGSPITLNPKSFEEAASAWLNNYRYTVAPKTTGRRLTTLRVFAKYCGIVNPLDGYSIPRTGPSIPHPIPEGITGVHRMISHGRNEEQKALVALCGLVGCRVSEALSVRPGDFNLDEMTLSIRGKGDRTRVVPVSESAWSVLCNPVARAILNGSSTVVSYHDRFARKTITNMGIASGLARRVASHDLRATFATAAYNQSNNLRVVQELLGHSSSQTTETYTQVRMDQMRKAAEL